MSKYPCGILDIHAPNTKASTFIRETLLKVKPYIKHHTLIVEDFNTSLSPINRPSRQKLKREIMKLTDV